MASKNLTSPFVGNWTYRSFLNKPELDIEFNELAFAVGTIKVKASAMEEFTGTIGGPGWELKLTGSASYGNPYTVRFQGVGTINKATWVYDYVGYLIPSWPHGVNQRPAIVGSVIRTVPHPNAAGGVSAAGVVASFIAVRQ
jgi:hypothetical protein